ncbi:MAG: alpha/beta hydrolase [SAR202 cluster bacterium]|nr:alpha/beta hydrolase [SAR202 cluster bacterium]
MLSERSFDAGALTINYAEGPANGPPLVMLHGGTDRWASFESVIPALSEDWHIYALDFRGHGKSGRVPGAYRIPQYASDVVTFLKSNIGEPATLMGHSMGADSSLWIAAEAPETVRAAVLEEPLYSHNGTRIKDFAVYPSLLAFQSAISTQGSMQDVRSELTRLRPNWPESLIGEKAACLAMLDPDVLSLIVEGHHTDGYDTEDLLPRISAPVLMIQGDPERGGLLNDSEAERMQSLLGDCTFVKMPGSGHEPHNRQTDKFLEISRGFFEGL